MSEFKWYTKVDNRYPSLLYAKREYRDDNGRKHSVFLHRFVVDPDPGWVVDHIDGDGLNNTRANLRICTGADNARNRRLHRNNSTGYRGVYARGLGFDARIRHEGRLLFLGTFPTAEEAGRVRDQAALEYFGEFASLNFPEAM